MIAAFKSFKHGMFKILCLNFQDAFEKVWFDFGGELKNFHKWIKGVRNITRIYLVSRLKHSLKDTANPVCNQLLASLYKQSSTQALAPEKERIIGGAR